MKKKVKTRKKITLQSVIMYILLILTALMFATPMLFCLLYTSHILENEKKEKSKVKKQVPLRLSKELYDEIAQWAEDEFRSMNRCV